MRSGIWRRGDTSERSWCDWGEGLGAAGPGVRRPLRGRAWVTLFNPPSPPHTDRPPDVMITSNIARAALLLVVTGTGACATAGGTTSGRPSGFDFARLADSIVASAPLDR